MPQEKQTRPPKKIDKLDILSAIWIMASNDDFHLITYRGIQDRLDLPDGYEVRAQIRERPELFRPNASEESLEQWRKDMLEDKRLPAWIRKISDPVKRKEEIEKLTAKDAFRSQFRANPNSPKSGLEIIDWGLQHIDRLRKAKLADWNATA